MRRHSNIETALSGADRYDGTGEVLKTMRERAAKFSVEKVKQEDIASTGGAADG